MTQPSRTAESSASDARPPGALIAYRAVIGVFTLLVLVQAALAGQFLNGLGNLRKAHQIIGMGLPFVALVLIVLALLGRRFVGTGLLITSAVLGMLTLAQTGLGFVGRQQLEAASIHIPVGVAIFGLSIFALGQVKRSRR